MFQRFRIMTFTCLLASVGPTVVWGHGPQLQITNDNGKLVTREIILDGPYSDSVTASKHAYVMPLSVFSGTTYSHPNGSVDPVTGLAEFPSGPGFAYGSDLVDGGPQAFAESSVLTLSFSQGLRKWDGSQFVDAGDAQLKAFRGSDPTIASPVENFAVTTDVAPFDGLSLAPIALNYGADGVEAHASIRFAVLGDGISLSASVSDGVYLATMQVSSSQSGIGSSDPYYFLLHQSANASTLSSATQSLGLSSTDVQFVPEPTGLAAILLAVLLSAGRNRRSARR